MARPKETLITANSTFIAETLVDMLCKLSKYKSWLFQETLIIANDCHLQMVTYYTLHTQLICSQFLQPNAIRNFGRQLGKCEQVEFLREYICTVGCWLFFLVCIQVLVGFLTILVFAAGHGGGQGGGLLSLRSLRTALKLGPRFPTNAHTFSPGMSFSEGVHHVSHILIEG